MKLRFKMVLGFFSAFALSGLLWGAVAHGQSFSSTVKEGETVNGTVYAAGQSVQIDGTVNGDVMCAAQEVIINGVVNGDVLCAGQMVTINGKITGSVRVAGQQVTVEAIVGRALTAAGQQIKIDKDTKVGQDATLAGDRVDIWGQIGRDAIVGSTTTNVDGQIGRNLRFSGTSLNVKDGAVINGWLTYTSRENVNKGEDAQILGGIDHKLPKDEPREPLGMSIISALGVIVAFVLLSLTLVALLPGLANKVRAAASGSLGKVLLTGFVAMFAAPIAIALLFSTLVGIPLAILVMAMGMVVILLSGPVAAYYFGGLMLAKSKNPIYMVLLGSSVLMAVSFVPVLGAIVMFVAYLIGSGAILLTAYRKWPKPVYKA